MIEVLHRAAVIVPSNLHLQFAVDPIFSFGINAEAVNRLDAALIHGLIAAKQIVDEEKAIVNADSLAEVFNRGYM